MQKCKYKCVNWFDYADNFCIEMVFVNIHFRHIRYFWKNSKIFKYIVSFYYFFKFKNVCIKTNMHKCNNLKGYISRIVIKFGS